MRRRDVLRWLLGGAGLLVAAGTASYASGQGFGVSRHRLRLPGLKRGLRVVQLSDLHFGRFHGIDAIKRWVGAAIAQRPDLVLLTGDIVDAWVPEADFQDLSKALSHLHAPLGAWAVPGNHDFMRFYDSVQDRVLLGFDAVRDRLARANIRTLVNEGVRLRSDLYLAGVDDLWLGQPNLRRALRYAPQNTRHGATLLMSHNPDLLPDVPEWVGLTVCGHTHGGQVRVPGVPFTMFNASRFGERFQMGFVRAPALGFISRGLGTTNIPFRAFCPAELVVFDLEPA